MNLRERIQKYKPDAEDVMSEDDIEMLEAVDEASFGVITEIVDIFDEHFENRPINEGDKLLVSFTLLVVSHALRTFVERGVEKYGKKKR